MHAELCDVVVESLGFETTVGADVALEVAHILNRFAEIRHKLFYLANFL